MDYNIRTQELIDRMCRYVERKDFVLDKKTAKEKLLKTYDLFGIPRPKKVVWVKDVFDTKFQEVLGATYRDWETDRKSTRLNSSHSGEARMPSSA